MANIADTIYTFRFLKILTTPWDQHEAFKLGIIDKKGKLLMKSVERVTIPQKDAYTTFHRLVFNIKRILEKIPFGSSKMKSYAAALFLIREETGMSEASIVEALEHMDIDTSDDIQEDTNKLIPGDYILNETVSDSSIKGTVITLEDTNPVGLFAGIDIYKSTNNTYFTANNVI